MTKIEQGILINSQHQYNVLNNIPEEISFRDQILALGYKDIEEFFKEKAIYEMQEVLKTHTSSVPMNNLVPVLFNAIQNNDYGIISIYTNETCVCHGQNTEKKLNEEYCQEHNIPIYPYNSFGGNIIATKEDYGVAFFIPSSIDISTQLVLENIALILDKYFNNIKIEDNDILIDNKKVIGAGSLGNDDIICILIYFSMNDKGDLIYNICGEPTTPSVANALVVSVAISAAAPSGEATANYTPAGSVTISNISITPSTASVAKVTNAGTAYQLTAGSCTKATDTTSAFATEGVVASIGTGEEAETLILTAASTSDAVTAAGAITYVDPVLSGSLPTFGSESVVTGITSATADGSFDGTGVVLSADPSYTTASATVTQPTFTAEFTGTSKNVTPTVATTAQAAGTDGKVTVASESITPSATSTEKTVSVTFA